MTGTNDLSQPEDAASAHGEGQPDGRPRGGATPDADIALPREIERKFLLSRIPDRVRAMQGTFIEQGWIPGHRIHERIRRSSAPGRPPTFTRTIKLGDLGARIELEDECDAELFAALWPLTRRARIRKHRYPVAHGAHVWEIDVFLDRPLVVAEIELRTLGEPFDVPDWLAPYIVSDVTDDPAYTNSAMATPSTDE